MAEWQCIYQGKGITDMSRRVVVTGMGAVTPIGIGVRKISGTELKITSGNTDY